MRKYKTNKDRMTLRNNRNYTLTEISQQEFMLNLEKLKYSCGGGNFITNSTGIYALNNTDATNKGEITAGANPQECLFWCSF